MPSRSPVPSLSSQQSHRPPVPSGLRQAQLPPSSPEDVHHLQVTYGQDPEEAESDCDITHPTIPEYAAVDWETSTTPAQGEIVQGEMVDEPQRPPPDARTALLGDGRKYHIPTQHNCGEEGCQHGTLSPRPRYQRGYGSFATNQTCETRRESYLDSRAQGQIDGHGPEEGSGGWWRSERWTYVAQPQSQNTHAVTYVVRQDYG